MLAPRLEFRQTQSLVMTPQLRQAIKLLQCTNIEAAAFVDEELERNPLLERDESGDALPERPAPDQRGPEAAPSADTAEAMDGRTAPDAAETDTSNLYDSDSPGDMAAYVAADRIGPGGRPPGDERGLEETAAGRRSLRDHLAEQVRLSFSDPGERLVAAHFLAMLDEAGRVPVETGALARHLGADPARVAAVRDRMMRFDPPGLFARDLRECLAAQLAERNRLDPAMATLLDNLDLLARRELRRLMELCEVDAGDLKDMIAEIRALDPKPGAGWDAAPLRPVVPDVLMRRLPDASWLLELNPETTPRVLVNERFHARVCARAPREDRAFIAEKLSAANWLVKSLAQRAATILRVAGEIVRQQDAFMERGVAHLRPLILRDVAEAVELHESTVSRVTSNKFIATPRGVFELKYFFTTAIASTTGESHSAEAVRHRIRALVGAEHPDRVLSDDAIVAALRREGVDIARRTVAKYREALRIPASGQRRREKAVPA